MNRVRDYINFAVKFVGLGYIVLWPLSSVGASGELFGAAFVCGGRLGAAVGHLCRMPHPLGLSLGLHVVGAVFAVLALAHLAAQTLRARRGATQGGRPPDVAPAALLKAMKARLRFRPLPPPRKLARPRKEFGLRGVPR